MKVVVVGGGSWGTAFSRVLANREHDVTLACRDAEQVRAIEKTHRSARESAIRLKKFIETLSQRTVELAASNRELSLEITQRMVSRLEHLP